MPDNTQNQKVSVSPWDEEPPPEEPKKDPIVGSFNGHTASSNDDPEKKPVPFNIPADINDEKVGKKISAEEVMKKEAEVAPAQIAPTIYPAPVSGVEKTTPETKPVLPDIGTPKDQTGISNVAVSAPTISNPTNSNLTSAPNPTSAPAPVQPKTEIPAPIKKPVMPPKPSFFKRPSVLITFSILFILIIGAYLTEAGVLSLGFERVYGVVGVEGLWGGLPRNPERALGISVQKMQSELNFKIKGNITLTVNKSIKSPITTPLVSVVNLPFAFKNDQNVGSATKSIFAQYDYYGTSDSASSGTAVDTTTDAPDTTSPTPADTENIENIDSETTVDQNQQDSASYAPEESTIKQIEAEFNGESSADAIKNEIKIKKLVGADSTISLINNKQDLYIKSSADIKYDAKAVQNKWLNYKLSKIEADNPVSDLTKIKLDKGFSIIGGRNGNEKIGKVRCYKYKIDDLELGDSLDYLGVGGDSTTKISGNIWIGVADKYIHKIDLRITPSASSSVSLISVVFEMYDFGIDNSIIVPALTDKIDAISGTTAPTEEPAQPTATTPDQTRKSDLSAIKNALELYKQANGSFPIAKTMIHLETSGNVVETALAPEFIATLPTDPKLADGWYYAYQSNGATFTLSTRLESTTDPETTKIGDAYIHWVKNN